MEYLSALTLDDWRNISIVAQGLLMIALVCTGIYQLLAIRAENQRNRTLEVCGRLSSDAPLIDSLHRLSGALWSGDFGKAGRKYRPDVVTVLNYFDLIAVGISEGIYEEELVRRFMEGAFKGTVERYLTGNVPKMLDIDLGEFEAVIALARKWNFYPPVSEENRPRLKAIA